MVLRCWLMVIRHADKSIFHLFSKCFITPVLDPCPTLRKPKMCLFVFFFYSISYIICFSVKYENKQHLFCILKACEKMSMQCNFSRSFLLVVMKSPEGEINFFSAVCNNTTTFFFKYAGNVTNHFTHFLRYFFPYFVTHNTKK